MRVDSRPRTRVGRPRFASAASALLAVLVAALAVARETGTDRTATATRETDDPAPLSGQVLDAEGRPLAGATVTIVTIPEDGEKTYLASRPGVTRTGEDGRFAGGQTAGSRFDVRVQAEGHAFRTLRGYVPSGNLTLRLDRGHPLAGSVRAETTGHGIADVRVELDDGEVPGDDMDLDFAGAGLETTTDNAGRYRFEHAPGGKVWVRATAAGWARRTIGGEVQPAADGTTPSMLDDLWLPEGGTVSGRVVDPDGKPVAGVRIFMMGLDLQGGRPRYPFPHAGTWTDEDGRYEIAGVTAGNRYRVSAEHDSFARTVTDPIPIDAGTVREDVDLTLLAGASLRVRLVDAQDRPCTQAALSLDSEDGARTDLAFRQVRRSTRDGEIETDDDGRLTLRKLPPGRFSIRIVPEGWMGLERVGVVLKEGESTDLGTIELEAGSTVRGRVIDEGGEPVAEAGMTWSWQYLTSSHSRYTTSDSKGRFSVGGLPDHALTVRVTANGLAAQVLHDVRAGEEEVLVTLLRRGSIHGKVTLAEGGPPSSFSVETYTDTDRGAVRASPRVETGDGSFEIHDLDPGPYRVEIRAAGWAPARFESVRVRPGESTDAGVASLRAGLRIRGRAVMPETGAGLAGASVRIDRGAGPTRWAGETGQMVTTTDEHGRFAFDGLEAGRSTLTVFHRAFAPAQRSLDLVAGTEAAEIEIGLTAGGEIRGSVVDGDGLPVEGARLQAYRGGRGFDSRLAATLEDGSFRFPRLAPGTYVIIRTLPAASSPFGRQVKTVEVREGQVTRVDFGRSGR